MSAADEYFKKAEQAAKKGNYEYAIELTMQGLILNPASSDWRRKLHVFETVAVQEKGGNPHGGMTMRFKVMPIQANIKKLMMQKKFDEAVVELEKCLRFQPQNAPALAWLAQALESAGHIDGAIGTLEEVVGLDRTNVEAYRKLGSLWARKDEPEKAIEYWQKVQQYKPDDKEAGKAMRDLSAATMVKKAEERKRRTGDESFTALLKSEDESADLEKKAKVIRTDEDRVEAIRLKMDDLRKDPKNSRLWREIGSLFQDLKKWDKAEQAFRKALEVNPHDLFATEKIGALREAMYDDELKRLQDELALGEGKEGYEERRAKVKERETQVLAFKVQEYERRVKAHPTDYELKVRYGQYLMGMSRFDEAIEQFQRSVKDPKFKIVSLDFIGTCFRHKRLYEVSEQQYRQALDAMADKDSELGKQIQYNLAIVAEKRKDKDGALKWYQKIMAVDIGYRDVSSRVSKIMAGGWPEDTN